MGSAMNTKDDTTVATADNRSAANRELTPLEICRLTAEALGYEIVHPGDDDFNTRVFKPEARRDLGWNPLAYPEQRWECLEWLFKYGRMEMGRSMSRAIGFGSSPVVTLICPAHEFPARAVAAVWLRGKAQETISPRSLYE